MGLVNLTNGHFELPGSLVLSPTATLPDFEAALDKGAFQPRWKDNYSGFEEHFLASPIYIGDEKYLFTFFFKYRKLVTTHFHVEQMNAAMENISEEETYTYYRSWLDREVGKQRVFPWGFCDLRFDPKSMFGYIELNYDVN